MAVGVSDERHPIALFFHWFWKVSAWVFYIFCTWFSDSFILNFVTCVVLIALDFWTVSWAAAWGGAAAGAVLVARAPQGWGPSSTIHPSARARGAGLLR